MSIREEIHKMKMHIQSSEKTVTLKQKLMSTLHSISKEEFLKPFMLMNLILSFGLEWAGFPALAFYMHSILKQMDIPLNEYWVAVGLAGYRSSLTVALSFVLYKVIRSQFPWKNWVSFSRPEEDQYIWQLEASCSFPQLPWLPTI